MMVTWTAFAAALALGVGAQHLGLSDNIHRVYYQDNFQQTIPETFPQQYFPQSLQAPNFHYHDYLNNYQLSDLSRNTAFQSSPSAINNIYTTQPLQHIVTGGQHQAAFNSHQFDGSTEALAFQANPHANPVSFAPTKAPFVPIDSQYQSVDEYGGYTFGFRGGDLARTETRDAFGNVRGSYDYIDSEGKLQTQHYIADKNGFRVIGSNLPQAPEAIGAVPSLPQVVNNVQQPKPVQDTPEVAAAKAAFIKAYNKAALEAAEAPDID
ncbi:hypothetical protein SK128_023123 [Halocaridina rubra]|uniref:Cuticle protein 6 n=1 Tax=Halocaridina rubra TaxID=373956 RepID=A0AAN9A047_HALRR